VLKAMKPGQMVDRTLLAAATTNGSGHYTLMVPAASRTAASALISSQPGTGVPGSGHKERSPDTSSSTSGAGPSSAG
jgi:hypothetical protein